ncbi:homeobox-leucine zipper protein HAT4-like [Impatiens glandulifera]|uniref:homeobox-leucine zipper protein HAT4-like n=1 Tax=Impatiens glandulifera TaxID=253017 RepID=UPI001FB0B3CE|nr:homeobox-leucine zipper protein HAT4-like [Impatiens glandulifera]
MMQQQQLEKEDFGLCLSLTFPEKNQNPHPPPIHFNLMPSLPSIAAAAPATVAPHKSLWNETFSSSIDRSFETCRDDTRSFLKGIDVNRLPSVIDCEEEAGVSSPNSTVSSISGKRCERLEPTGDDHDGDRDFRQTISDEEDGDPSRKKLRLSKDQSVILEESFKEHNTLNPKQKMALAKRLGLRPRQVEVWFQNRRARTKLKQTEVDCEFLKRCCENLTEENRRLQKEVQELRALKMSPQFYMQMTPPTTLTMCPSCERVATAPPSSAAPPSQIAHNHQHHHHRPMPINLWAAAPPPATRQFDGLRPRS